MKFVPNAVSRKVNRQALIIKKNSPGIFFVGGIAGILGSTVMACRATLKLDKTMHEIRTDLEDIKTKKSHNDHYVREEDYIRDLTFVYTQSAFKLAKLYGPSILLGGASIAALTVSHNQLQRRNAALSYTLAAVSKAFDEYRVRVAEEIGEKKELEIYRDVQAHEVEINGQKELVKTTGPNGFSIYARCFDESSHQFEKNAEQNHIFLKLQQSVANQRLKQKGHLFLNDVYDALGFEDSQAGAVVGWLWDGDGDNYIDFGLNQSCLDDYYEPRIWVDFNVDGVIYDKI